MIIAALQEAKQHIDDGDDHGAYLILKAALSGNALAESRLLAGIAECDRKIAIYTPGAVDNLPIDDACLKTAIDIRAALS